MPNTTTSRTFGLVWVFGPARSGTTLLAALLAREGAFPMLPECTIIMAALSHRLHMLCVAADPRRYGPYAIDDQTLDTYYRDLIDKLIDNAVSQFEDDRPNLVLKDPELCSIARYLHRFSSRPMRSVCIVRDPRDTVASMYEVRQRGGEATPDLDSILAYLGGQYAGLMSALDAPQEGNPIHLVRYDDLVRRDLTVLQHLEAFCGYPLHIDEFQGVPEGVLVRESPFYKTTLLGPVTDERVASHLGVLNQDQIRRTEDAFSTVMHRFGYQPSANVGQLNELRRRIEELSDLVTESAQLLEAIRQELNAEES